MRIHFRRVKDIAYWPLDFFMRSAPLPYFVKNGVFNTAGLAAEAFYLLPGNHARTTLKNFCRMTRRNDHGRIFSQCRRNLVMGLGLFTKLIRQGPEVVADKVVIDPASFERVKRVQKEYGNGIFVVPHCAGSILAATRFGREFQSVILIRESKSKTRAAALRKYFEKLGPELVFVRTADPAAIARNILKVLHDKKFIIGTTDLARKAPDTVPATVFGQTVTLPAWPARFSARRKVPIIPGYMHMQDGRIVLECDEPYIEQDVARATQRWANYFEKMIITYPSDWMFMFDKHWAKHIAAAAKSQPRGFAPGVSPASF